MNEARPPRWTPLAAIALVALPFNSCARRETSSDYVPGLGEIMTLNQMRHTKLWLAGREGNWPLADYEIDELEEGFADAVKFHPTHKDSPAAIKDLLPQVVRGPLGLLRSAVQERDREAFTRAFDTLTEACNGCHRATEFGFNVVVRPTGNPFPNQDFSPPPPPNGR